MIGHRLLTPAEVEAKLQPRGCYWATDLDERLQLWLTAWGFAFTMPILGDDRMTPESVLFAILAEIEHLRPPH